MQDSAAATSHGAATTHAYGVKANKNSYGMIDSKSIKAASGFQGSIIEEAKSKGLKTALINSGSIIEPGTGAFAAKAKNRSDYDSIAAQIINSGVPVIMSGGEEYMLPAGVKGRHGFGKRNDKRNLIEEAEKLGYKIVYTKAELEQAVKTKPDKLLGVFATSHTFNDLTEAQLIAQKLPHYVPTSPTIGEMVGGTLKLFEGHKFLMIVEEEGTDNFSNVGNPDATLEALKRADDALGIMMDYHEKMADLMIITASDSDAGGLQIKAAEFKTSYSYKNNSGDRIYFNLQTAGTDDYAGGILVRSTQKLPAVIDNTKIYKIIADYLFEPNAE